MGLFRHRYICTHVLVTSLYDTQRAISLTLLSTRGVAMYERRLGQGHICYVLQSFRASNRIRLEAV